MRIEAHRTLDLQNLLDELTNICIKDGKKQSIDYSYDDLYDNFHASNQEFVRILFEADFLLTLCKIGEEKYSLQNVTFFTNHRSFLEPWQILICRSKTTSEKTSLFIKRSFIAAKNIYKDYLFCIANVEYIDFKIKYNLAVDHHILDQFAENIHPINGLDSESIKILCSEICDHATCMTSNMSRQDTSSAMANCKLNTCESLPLDITLITYLHEINFFLFELLTLGIFSNELNVVHFPQTLIFIEITPIQIVSHYMDVHSRGALDDSNIHFIRNEAIKTTLPDERHCNDFIEINLIVCCGKASCGKIQTSLISLLSVVMEVEFLALNIHAGVHEKDILTFMEKATKLAIEGSLKLYKEKGKFVYQVHPMPDQILDYVWDYGQLKKQMINKITSRLCVSLRDVKRAIKLFKFIKEKFNKFNYSQHKNKNVYPETHSLVLALSLCYILDFTTSINKPRNYYQYKDFFERIISQEQEYYFKRMRCPEGTAVNEALLENLLIMIICIQTQISVFIIGAPG
ncbi:13056_t:CDS:10, partial [Gigaspora margarita]